LLGVVGGFLISGGFLYLISKLALNIIPDLIVKTIVRRHTDIKNFKELNQLSFDLIVAFLGFFL